MTTIDEFLAARLNHGTASADVIKAEVVDQMPKKLTIGGFLAHYGIRGMKWGVRRERGPAGTVSSNPAAKTATGPSPRRLNDKDLQAAVQRMRLEREFRQLRDSERPAKGESFTKNMLKEIGKKQVRRVANSAADIAVEQALLKVAGKTGNHNIEETVRRMQPKKKK